MTKDDKDIVSALRSALADRVENNHLQLWLTHPDSLSLETGQVMVRAADEFALERLRRNLRSALIEAVQQVLGAEVEVVFRVDAALKRGREKTGKAVVKAVAAPSPQKLLSFFDGDEADNNAASLPSSTSTAITSTITCPAATLAASPAPVAHTSVHKQRTGRKFAQLETFVVGDENRLAHAAAMAMPARLGQISPLYLHGPTGTGKTHLMEAIWSNVRRASPRNQCLYLAAEQFTTLFLEALHGKGLPSFRKKYRDVDLFMIDDIQFLHGKRATLQELLAAVDFFASEHKQLVLAADRPPVQLPGLADELVARLSSGLVVELVSAGVDTKRAILARFLGEQNRTFSKEVMEQLAVELPGDARLLRGAVNRLSALRDATGLAITPRLVRESCKDLLSQSRRMIQLVDIERAVCEVFGISAKNLQSAKKDRVIAQPRMLALWLSRKYTRAGLTEIGTHFGLKSHTSVLAAHKKVEGWLSDNQSIRMAEQECEVQDALRRVELELRAS